MYIIGIPKTDLSLHGQLEEIDLSIVRLEDSPQAQIETIRGHNQSGSYASDRILGDEGEQQE